MPSRESVARAASRAARTASWAGDGIVAARRQSASAQSDEKSSATASAGDAPERLTASVSAMTLRSRADAAGVSAGGGSAMAADAAEEQGREPEAKCR